LVAPRGAVQGHDPNDDRGPMMNTTANTMMFGTITLITL